MSTEEYPLPIIGTSEPINRARLLAKAAARYDVNVLLLGESGVGKELFARTIHLLGSRKEKPFIAMNCSAIPDTLLESEVFGYERGAFTDAHKQKPGKLELADGGTLFLDEVGEMSISAQLKLLRVLEEDKSFERLGGTRSIKVDVRIIAATNADLQKKIAQGVFRKDLFYRLSEFVFEISPIRQREDDIRQLIDFYLDQHCQKLNITRPGIEPDLLASLTAYPWPGNVRELKNALIQALVIKNGHSHDFGLTDFSHLNLTLKVAASRTEEARELSLKEAGAAAAEKIEREMVLKMLGETNWSRKEAARRLKVGYKTLRNKLEKWGVRQPFLD